MTPEKWARLEVLFERALELPAAERTRFAEEACGDDQELRSELLRLLESDTETDSFLKHPALLDVQTCTWTSGDTVLDRFQIVRLVGRGGMGEVYEARDPVLNQRVALKTIRPEAARDPQVLARFKQEINLARKVTDPHVSRIYEIFTEPTPFLTMEFLEGVTLSHKIRSDGRVPESETRCIALQLCQALQAAHKAGVVHRDFKSGNVMVNVGEGGLLAVVTDFGLATMMARSDSKTVTAVLTRRGAIMGTVPYMAPEQLEGGVAEPATDLYALGIVLYEMLTGKTPFPSASPMAAAVERLKHRPDPPSKLVPGLDAVWDRVIGQCLEYEKEKRPGSAAEVVALLEHLTPPQPVLKFSRTVPRRWVFALVPALLLLGGGFFARTHWGAKYHPPSADAQKWYDDGTTALRDGTYLKAATALQRAISMDSKFVLAHARLADAYTELDYTDKAMREMIQASSLELLKDLPGIDRDYVEAVRSTIAGDFPGAVGKYRQILDALPTAAKAFGLVDLGRAYEKANQTQSAADAYASASQKAHEYPASFLRLGIMESRLDHLGSAKAAFETAATLYRASSNLEGEAEVAYQQGLAATNQGRLKPARTYIDQALSDARAIHSPQLEMRALLQLSAIEYLDGDTGRATADAQQAIGLAHENGIGVFWSTQGLVQLGGAFLSAGDYANAEIYLQKALGLARSTGSQRLEAFASVNLASVRDKQGRTEDAMALAKFAYSYYHEHGFVIQANSALTIIARAELDKGEVQNALKDYQDQVAFGSKAQDSEIVSDAEQGLGNVFEHMENYAEALIHYESALEAGKERDPGFLGYQAFHCAAMLAELGRYGEFETMLRRAESGEKAEPDLVPEIENIQAAAALARFQHVAAQNYCLKALRAQSPYSPAASVQVQYRLGLAQVELGNVSAGVTSCRSALAYAQKEAKTQVASASLALAEALLESGQLLEADSLVQAAIDRFHRDGQPESEWRGLFLQARIHRTRKLANFDQVAVEALDILNHFTHNWDALNAQYYLSRPDVRWSANELGRLTHSF